LKLFEILAKAKYQVAGNWLKRFRTIT
jgi:hypothetical protein